jgi:hypothetical protein
MTFANVVEGCLIYNFHIYRFCRSLQLFGETRSQSRVDRLKCCSAALQSAASVPGALPVWLRRAPRSESRARLDVRAGSLPTTSRSGPLVPFAPATLGTRAASSYRVVPAPRCPVESRRSRAHARRDGRRTAALKPVSRCCALPLKVAHRPALRRPQHTPVALPVRPNEMPLLRPVRHRPAPSRSPLDPTTYRCRPCLFPDRRSAGAQLAATVLPGRRRPANYRRPSAHPRPQIGCG